MASKVRRLEGCDTLEAEVTWVAGRTWEAPRACARAPALARVRTSGGRGTRAGDQPWGPAAPQFPCPSCALLWCVRAGRKNLRDSRLDPRGTWRQLPACERTGRGHGGEKPLPPPLPQGLMASCTAPDGGNCRIFREGGRSGPRQPPAGPGLGKEGFPQWVRPLLQVEAGVPHFSTLLLS